MDTAAEPAGPPSAEALVAAKRAIEAIVLVATDPIADQLLAQVIELPIPTVRRLCAELAESYAAEQRGFQFVEVAGGWRYQTHPDLAPYIEKYVLEGQTARLSSAALETLSIVAYKQPLSRAQMSAIRGVNVDGVLRTLVQKGYIEEIGRDAGPGQATLVRHHRALPRAARARQDRRPSAVGRVRSGCQRRRGARNDSASRARGSRTAPRCSNL